MQLHVRCRRNQNSIGIRFKPFARLVKDQRIYKYLFTVNRLQYQNSVGVIISNCLWGVSRNSFDLWYTVRGQHRRGGGTLVIVKCMGGCPSSRKCWLKQSNTSCGRASKGTSTSVTPCGPMWYGIRWSVLNRGCIRTPDGIASSTML